MDEKMKELIAIGASIGANCMPCLEWHYNKAVEIGVSDKEIKIAIEIGKKVKGVAGDKIIDLADKLTKTEKSCKCGATKCCG